MRKYFRVADCTRHVGLPIKKACIIFCIISCLLYGFTLYFLPLAAGIPLMIAEVVIGIIGLVASCTKVRTLTVLYLVGQSLMLIPVWVVMGYVIYTLFSYNTSYYSYEYNNWFYSLSEYQRRLYTTSLALLWLVMMTGFIGTIVSSISLIGFRKLRIFQLGTHNIIQVPGPYSPASQPPTMPSVYQPQQFYTVPQPQQPVYQMPGPYQNQQVLPQPVQPYPAQAFPGPTQQVGFEPPPAYTEPEVVRSDPSAAEPKRHSIYA